MSIRRVAERAATATDTRGLRGLRGLRKKARMATEVVIATYSTRSFLLALRDLKK